jgi:hypothetical protein
MLRNYYPEMRTLLIEWSTTHPTISYVYIVNVMSLFIH